MFRTMSFALLTKLVQIIENILMFVFLNVKMCKCENDKLNN